LIGSALTDSGSGYLLVSSALEKDVDPSKMRVVRGRLCWPEGVNEGRPIVEFDHALLALERYDTVVEKTGLAPTLFEQSWKVTREAIGSGDKNVASATFDKLRSAIFASPDITEADRVALLGGYEKIYQGLADKRWPKQTSTEERGAGDRDTLASRIITIASDTRSPFGTELSKVAQALSERGEVDLDPHQIDAKTDISAIIDAALTVRRRVGEQGAPNVTTARGLASILMRASVGSYGGPHLA
jgi:hypothetical protein